MTRARPLQRRTTKTTMTTTTSMFSDRGHAGRTPRIFAHTAVAAISVARVPRSYLLPWSPARWAVFFARHHPLFGVLLVWPYSPQLFIGGWLQQVVSSAPFRSSVRYDRLEIATSVLSHNWSISSMRASPDYPVSRERTRRQINRRRASAARPETCRQTRVKRRRVLYEHAWLRAGTRVPVVAPVAVRSAVPV